MYWIYKITNKINGKSYVGFTKDVKKRMRMHRYDGNKLVPKFAVHKAIKKYGWDTFDVSVLAGTPDKRYALEFLEPMYIAQFNCLGEGYNLTRGGEGTAEIVRKPLTTEQKLRISTKTKEAMWRPDVRRRQLDNTPPITPERIEAVRQAHLGTKASAETRRKQSLAHKGKIISETQKLQIGVAQTERFKDPAEREKVRQWVTGLKRSEESKEKNRQAHLGKRHTQEFALRRSKSYVMTKPDGTEETVVNLAKYCREHGLAYSNMVQVSKGKFKQQNGWKCRAA